MQQKVALVNSIKRIHKTPRLRERTEPGLIAFHNIWPENGVCLFIQPGAHMAPGARAAWGWNPLNTT